MVSEMILIIMGYWGSYEEGYMFQSGWVGVDWECLIGDLKQKEVEV